MINNLLYKSGIFMVIGQNMMKNHYTLNKINVKHNIELLKENYCKKLLNEQIILNLEMNELTNKYNELSNKNTIIKLKNKFAFVNIDKTYYSNLQEIENIDKKIINLETIIKQIKEQYIKMKYLLNP